MVFLLHLILYEFPLFLVIHQFLYCLFGSFHPPLCLSVSLLLPVSAVKALSCRMWHMLHWANPSLNCAGCCCHYFVLEMPAPCHFKTCISHLERDISEECVVSTKLLSSPYGCKIVSYFCWIRIRTESTLLPSVFDILCLNLVLALHFTRCGQSSREEWLSEHSVCCVLCETTFSNTAVLPTPQ